MNLNINTSDSQDLNQPESQPELVKKYAGHSQGSDEFDPTNGWIVQERGVKTAKWYDTNGKLKEKIL